MKKDTANRLIGIIIFLVIGYLMISYLKYELDWMAELDDLGNRLNLLLIVLASLAANLIPKNPIKFI